MMEWALAIIFIVAVIMVVLSFVKSRQTATSEKQKVDMMYLNFMEEMNKLEDKVRSVELDVEIMTQEVGIQTPERTKLRELLDLYRRGYSIESIAAKENLLVTEIEQLLSPYVGNKDERREA
ncbi:hypothetical protein [Bacillus suaedaesalsae]|uniref:DUF2802 domain-containing protein n=1 Tax=Bacillus suaedaesalsae TaxID=2810349 RepID=A0ABS2DM29_9BACI|nr:hypothetical protein [Bacillus suaedaesalsae]MBM6619529.1 hypothetical protein [Bacillus suaedaesalsae]